MKREWIVTTIVGDREIIARFEARRWAALYHEFFGGKMIRAWRGEYDVGLDPDWHTTDWIDEWRKAPSSWG